MPPLRLDVRSCERARHARDARFDGLFYTAVTTTGVYCRPVCPAPAARTRNVRYYASAAAAAAAGFRPCLRCRPEAAPGSPLHAARSGLVGAALALIADGALDRAGLPALAARIGVGERHLRRLFVQELGAAPVEVAATRRLLFAKQLVDQTTLPLAQVALAAGYASTRRFNAAFVASYGKPPRELRRARGASANGAALVLRLPYRAPYDFTQLLAFLARRAIPQVEQVSAHAYRRSIEVNGVAGWFEVSQGERDTLALRVHHPAPAALGAIVTRVRRMFDVDADPRAIAQVLQRDCRLRDLQRRWPGQRLPGAWDGFEVAVRAVLGQQVSVAAARTLAARIVAAWGTPCAGAAMPGIDRLFPVPAALVEAPLEHLGVTRARAATIRGLARALLDGRIDFNGGQALDAFERALVALPGIGAWTAHYIAMRALGQPDALPAADLVLRRAAGQGRIVSARELEAMSQSWRPWRAYAVMLLWRAS